jgi:hypothetical protein
VIPNLTALNALPAGVCFAIAPTTLRRPFPTRFPFLPDAITSFLSRKLRLLPYSTGFACGATFVFGGGVRERLPLVLLRLVSAFCGVVERPVRTG